MVDLVMIVKDFNDRYEPIPSVAIVYWFPTHIQISVSYLQPLIFIAWIKFCISYYPCVARLDSVLGKEICVEEVGWKLLTE